MKEIRENIEELKKSVSNMGSEESTYAILDILGKLTDKLEEVSVNQEAIEENIKFMDTDLSDIQEELFEEVSFDDLPSFEDEYEEVRCKNCSQPIYMEKSVLNSDNTIKCPYCNKDVL